MEVVKVITKIYSDTIILNEGFVLDKIKRLDENRLA